MKFAFYYFGSMLALYAVSLPALFLSGFEILQTTVLWFISIVLCYPMAFLTKRTLMKI